MILKVNRKRYICEILMLPQATKSNKAIFSVKVTVKVTRSLTLVSFEKASLVEYACQISKSLCSLMVQKLQQRSSWQQTGQKQHASHLSMRGHKNKALSSRFHVAATGFTSIKHSGSLLRNACETWLCMTAKHSYAWLPRKCDYQSDRQTDAWQPDPYVPLCFAGDKINTADLRSVTNASYCQIFPHELN